MLLPKVRGGDQLNLFCQASQPYRYIIHLMSITTVTIRDRTDGSLPIDRWTNDWLPLKTITIPSSPMVVSPKNITIPLHWPNGCFTTIHLVAMVTLKTIDFVSGEKNKKKIGNHFS